MFSQRLKELREEKGVSRNELAEELKINYSTLGSYERGVREPNFETLKKLADYFGVTTDYLIGRSDFKTNIDDEIEAKKVELKKLNEKIKFIEENIEKIKAVIG